MSRGGAKFSADELALVLSHYNLGTIQSTKILEAGNRRAPKRIIFSENGKFLIKRRPRDKDDLYRVAFAHSAQQHLLKNSYPVSVLVPTRDEKNTVLNLNNHIYELFEFVSGDRYDGSKEATFNAGASLGHFHKKMYDFLNDFKPLRGTFHDSTAVRSNLRLISQKETNSNDNHALVHIGEELTTEYNHASTNVNQLGFDDWAEQIIHGDWHPGNMLFAGEKVVAVLDFDSVKIAPVVCDVANGMLQFSIVGGRPNPVDWPDYLDIDRLERFLQGYLSANSLMDEQLKALPDLMIEAMITEAVVPVAATGFFGHLSGSEFLEMIYRKSKWIYQNKEEITATIFKRD